MKHIDALMSGATGHVFPAAALLIFQSDDIRFHRAYGSLHPELPNLSLSSATRFDLASLTKLLTATAFMLLAQEGKVLLDTPVLEVLSEFGPMRRIAPTQEPFTYELAPPLAGREGEEIDVRNVLFRQHLTHTSGLAPWRALLLEGPQIYPVPFPHHVSAEARAQRIAAIYEKFGLAYPPGQRIAYSDLGFILLGEAVSRLSGLSLDVFIEQNILNPLDMNHTCFNPLARGVPRESIAPTEVDAWRERRCWGEVHDQNAASLGGVAGHAGLFSTTEDLLSLARMFLPSNESLLTPGLVTEMTREQARWQGLRRGLGWQLPSTDGAPMGLAWDFNSFGHTGFTGTSLWIDPSRRLIVVLLTNRVYFGHENRAITDFRIRLHTLIAEHFL